MEKILLRLFVPVLCAFGLFSTLNAQTIRYVKQGGAGNGSSWADASGDFQAMINASVANDEVWVAAGDYQTNPGTPFSMKEGVKIYGGFPNTGNPAMTDRNWSGNISRLIGRQLIQNGPPSCRVISNISNGLTVAAVLDGFTIYSGYALDHGGGMRNQDVSPTIRNCTFTQNSATGNGGGIYNANSHPVIINCIISGNQCGLLNSYGNGAGIYNSASNPTITNCEFNNNSVQRGSQYDGGGAMYNTISSPVITNCKFSGNYAYVGGAVFNYTASPQFVSSTFTGNSAGYRGGGVYSLRNSNSSFRYCSFSGNNSGTQGGGVANSEYSNMTLANCLFYANSGQYGGAMFNEMAYIIILNSTIAHNTASGSGGAIESSEYIPPNAADNLRISNTIIAGNSSGVNLYKNEVKVINSSVQSITPNGSNVRVVNTNNTDGSLDPVFVNPSDPDGPDNIIGTADDGYALQAISPVINMGSNAELSADLTTDMAGAIRIQGTIVDIGAYESASIINCGSTTLYVDGSRQSSGEGVSWSAAFKTLGEALNRAGACNNVNTILIAKGTYYPTGQQSGTDRNEAFVIPQRGGLKIYGGYPNGGGSRNQLLNPTILSGDIGTSGNNSDNSYHIIVATGMAANADSVVLDGLTVTKANANGSHQWYYNSILSYQDEGGGIMFRQNNNNSKLAIRNCNVIGNSALNYGAGIYCGWSSALINNCVSADNTGVQNGGGLFVHASDNVRLSGSAITGNTAVNGSAILTLDANLQVVNCTVSGNASGINNSGSSNTTILGSVLWNNGVGNIQSASALNISYSNIQQESGVYAGIGNINADPLFVNAGSPAGADGAWRTADDGFRLQSGSPAVNAGTPDISGLPLSTTDLAGQTRVLASRVDMGAYESGYIACSETTGLLFVDASVAQSGNGSSWSSAFRNLQEAFAVLQGCSNVNTILIAQGTYFPTNTTNREASFIIPSRGNLKIYGGYPAGGGTRDIMNYPTILSGDIGVAGNNGDNSYHVMVIANINAGADSIIVDGVSFTDGNASGSGSTVINGSSLSQNTGGGLLIANGNGNTKIVIRNCRSFNNRANQGAGIFNLAVAPAIGNTIVQGNISADNGGGMSNYGNARPTLINMLISGNRAGFGGAVFNDNSSPVFINSTIAGNYAGEAGGIFSRGNGVNVIFRNSIIYGNRNAAPAVSNIFNNSNGTCSFSYSLVETATGVWESALGTDNGNNLFTDPKFVNRIDPSGGNTPNTSGNYSIQNSSPAIDAGNNASLPAGVSTDLSGAARMQQGSVDMGAYESPYVNCSMFSATATVANIKCLGDKGSAVITIDKGVAPYTYAWSNGASTATVNDLVAGNYSCTITDANGCSTTKNIPVTGPATALVVSIDQTNIKCYGGNNGMASANASGGIAPYTYSWNNGSTAAALFALSPGTYTCAVTDAAGCVKTGSVIITQPTAAMSAITSQTDVLCYGSNTGIATVMAAGGTEPYTYSWSNGGSTASVSGLAAENYTCTITDAGGCTLIKNFTITQPATVLTASATHTDLNCFNGNNGTATITASGGRAPYTYTWNNGSSGAVLNNAGAGNYTCSVTDANGCIATVDVTIKQPASPITIVKNKTDVICFNAHTGEASVIISGGVAPYSYLWSNGGTGSSVSGLAAGVYSCTIQDAAGCSVVSAFNIDQPGAVITVTPSQTDVACYGGTTGMAEVIVNGGVAPYNYSWSDGANTSSISNLGIGAYSCTITDAVGCSQTQTFTITQPAAPLAVTGSQTDLTCYNGSNAAASVAVSGGTAPYTYSWNNGAAGTRIDNLIAGSYSCIVTDSKGCSVVAGFVIAQPANALTHTFSQTDVLCKNGNTGTAAITVSGGVAPYNYHWTTASTGASVTGLAAGGYNVLVTDANGCTTGRNFTISEPAQLSAQVISSSGDYCNSGRSGNATVAGIGGVSPYTYLWSNGSSAAISTGLDAGNYSCLITDANGCTTTTTVSIVNQPFAGNTVYVDSSIAVPGDGSNWTKAVRELSDALNIATSCNTVENILVARGTYKPVGRSGINNRDSTFLIRQSDGLKIYGGYPSGGGMRDIAANNTTLSGELGAGWDIGDNAAHIMVIAGVHSGADSIVVDGFNFIGGFTQFGGTYWYNGIEIENSGAAICLYNNNDAGGKIMIRNCNFNENYSMNKGGAIYNNRSSPAILNCTFTDNISIVNGGAIMNEHASSPLISDCKFHKNEGDIGGGAIYNLDHSNAIIRNSRFTENFCITLKGGGAIANESSAPEIIRCYLAGNYTFDYLPGGAIYNDHSSPKIINTVIAGNRAPRSDGGGIANYNNSSVTVSSSTIYGNLSIRGSVQNDASQMTVINSIIYGSPWELWNVNGGTANVSYSLVQNWNGGGTGNLNSNLDPMFINNTAPPYGTGDYRLKPCSPAINAGTSDTTGLNLPSIEMSDLPRVQLGRLDIGAMEANSYANGTASALPVTGSSTAAYQLKNGTTWYSIDCQTLIAAVTGSGANPVSGNTTASVDMDATQLPGSVSRVYEIKPDNDAATATGTITLYFTQAEFTAYNTANTSTNKRPLPDNNDPQMGDKLANIRIRKVSGGVTSIITPQVVNWNAGLERWELTFDVSGFSKFYVFTPDNSSLPLRLISFNVQPENCIAHISWATAEESGVSHFELEQSTDGSSWLLASSIPARNTAGENKYGVKININATLNFYRLKMIDSDGTITYSRVIRLNAPLSCADQDIRLYPNPVRDIIYLENVHAGDKYTVYDNAGRIIMQGNIIKAVQDIDAVRLVMGMYTITVVSRNGEIKALKFVKK